MVAVGLQAHLVVDDVRNGRSGEREDSGDLHDGCMSCVCEFRALRVYEDVQWLVREVVELHSCSLWGFCQARNVAPSGR